MSAEKRKLRRDLAKESSRLSYSGKKVNPKAKFDSETVQQITIGNSETRIAESKLDFQFWSNSRRDMIYDMDYSR